MSTSGRRRLALWAVIVTVVALAGAVLAGLRGPSGLPLDPDNPERGGLQALARVVEQQGVEVEVVRSLEAARATTVGPDTTVLVGGTAYLSPESGAALLEHAADADALLVLAPEPNAGEALGLPLTVSARSSSAVLGPGCDLPLWREGDTVVGADRLIEVTGGGTGVSAVCLPPSQGFSAGGTEAGYLVELDAAELRPRVLVLGIAPALTNERIQEGANAATGLRLLGATDRLLWYVPAIADAGEVPPQSLTDVLPPAFLPAVAILVATLAATMLWRGRRLGPVVAEPLPAVVRSVETTQSRSRMYRKAGDRGRALAALQLAARRRLAVRLGLSSRATAGDVVRAVAEATGRPAGDVARVLTDPSAQDDETLVRTAREVRSLEEGVRSR